MIMLQVPQLLTCLRWQSNEGVFCKLYFRNIAKKVKNHVLAYRNERFFLSIICGLCSLFVCLFVFTMQVSVGRVSLKAHNYPIMRGTSRGKCKLDERYSSRSAVVVLWRYERHLGIMYPTVYLHIYLFCLLENLGLKNHSRKKCLSRRPQGLILLPICI